VSGAEGLRTRDEEEKGRKEKVADDQSAFLICVWESVGCGRLQTEEELHEKTGLGEEDGGSQSRGERARQQRQGR
jgi:hypothetical protein